MLVINDISPVSSAVVVSVSDAPQFTVEYYQAWFAGSPKPGFIFWLHI